LAAFFGAAFLVAYLIVCFSLTSDSCDRVRSHYDLCINLVLKQSQEKSERSNAIDGPNKKCKNCLKRARPMLMHLPRMRTAAACVFAAMIFFWGCSKKRPVTAAPVIPAAGTMETGIASWYGHPYHGRRAANGEVYDMEMMTAAHRTYAFGTRVRVVNEINGKSVDVRINDRGPFVDGRIIDLSRAAARQIELIGPGTAKVTLIVLGYGPAPGDPVFAVQVGVFRELQRADELKKTLEKTYAPVSIVARDGDETTWRVLVGRKSTEQEASALAETLKRRLGDAFVVRCDE